MSKRDTLQAAYIRMKRNENNDFVYRKWFSKFGGLAEFKKDVGKPPSTNHVVIKINDNEPISPTNYKWVIKPKNVILNPKIIIPKAVYNCHTLILKIIGDIDRDKAGLYKITFNNGCFYIGSTGNIRRRISCWVGTFNGASKMHNKNIIKCVAECGSVYFELIQYVDDVSVIKEIETAEIKKHIGNKLLLNRAHDASSNKGVKWTDEEKRKTKETLIEKYRAGIYKPAKHRISKKMRSEGNLFRSKYFGDKE